LATACTTPPLRTSSVTEQELLFGTAAVGVADPPVPLSREEAFGLDEAMRAFVAAVGDDGDNPGERLEKLLLAMQERGLASLDYVNGVTHSARATFHAGSANCLSFTILFVALAREAGLRTAYQMVDVPPTWSNDGELVVIRNHVNALVDTPFGDDYVVDFNLAEFSENYDRRRIGDEYAYALFYNNLAAEALIRKDFDTSFRYLREAIGLDPEVTAAWSNLGLWYSRRGSFDHAEAAYLRALATSPADATVLVNLTALYATHGNQDLADALGERVRAYQRQNPYYHFAVAKAAYEQRRFDAALDALNRALRLKRDDHELYFWRGLAYLELGKDNAAEQSFARAKAYAAPGNIRAEYDARIQALAGDTERSD
jgi:Flp pilus assembly protein TadD